MIWQLWGSWLLLFIIARVIAVAAMLAVVLGMAWLPGNKAKRFAALMAHDGRNLFGLVLVAMVIALIGVYFAAQWWFTAIDFAPVGVAVFGSVGIAAIAWISKFIKNRKQFTAQLKAAAKGSNDDEQ